MGSTLALIALGSNLGDRRATLDRAISDLADTPGLDLQRVSTYLETAPVGGPKGQGAFLNAAIALKTTLDPFELHRLLLDVERRAGRVREVRWDARTLDLDLILFGNQVIDTPDLTVPHPRFAVRRFVLEPLAEIAPDSADPLTGRTVLELLVRLDRRPSYVALHSPLDSGLASRITQEVADTLGGEAVLREVDQSPEQRADPERWFDQLLLETKRIGKISDRLWTTGPDSWIVSDFCIDYERLRTGARTARIMAELPDANRVEFLERRSQEVEAIYSSAFSPTFGVALGYRDWGWGLSFLKNAVDFPTLIPDKADEDKLIAEIVSACRATRS